MARRHGTRAKFTNDGCRCGSCIEAARRYDRGRNPNRNPFQLPTLPPDDGWMDQGLCRIGKVPVDAFFPTVGENDICAEAKRICEGCPVTSQCLQFALAHNLYGIWGGTSQRGRRQMKARVA